MRGIDPNRYLHVITTCGERLENCAVRGGDTGGGFAPFRSARQRGRVGRGAGVSTMDRQPTEVHEQHHRAPGNQDDHGVHGHQLPSVSTGVHVPLRCWIQTSSGGSEMLYSSSVGSTGATAATC